MQDRQPTDRPNFLQRMAAPYIWVISGGARRSAARRLNLNKRTPSRKPGRGFAPNLGPLPNCAFRLRKSGTEITHIIYG